MEKISATSINIGLNKLLNDAYFNKFINLIILIVIVSYDVMEIRKRKKKCKGESNINYADDSYNAILL